MQKRRPNVYGINVTTSSHSHLMRHAGFLSGGCCVETLGSHKHRSPDRNHHCSLPANFGLDGWRRTVGIHQGSSICRPARSRGFLWLLVLEDALTPRQVSDVADGLSYLHSHGVIHGDLKGVRKVPKRPPNLLTRVSAKYSCGWRRSCASGRLRSRRDRSGFWVRWIHRRRTRSTMGCTRDFKQETVSQ